MVNKNRFRLPTRLISLLLTFCLISSCLAGLPVTGTGPEQETVPETTAATVPETTSATTPEAQPDPNADLETSAGWEATLPQTLSGKWNDEGTFIPGSV